MVRTTDGCGDGGRTSARRIRSACANYLRCFSRSSVGLEGIGVLMDKVDLCRCVLYYGARVKLQVCSIRLVIRRRRTCGLAGLSGIDCWPSSLGPQASRPFLEYPPATPMEIVAGDRRLHPGHIWGPGHRLASCLDLWPVSRR